MSIGEAGDALMSATMMDGRESLFSSNTHTMMNRVMLFFFAVLLIAGCTAPPTIIGTRHAPLKTSQVTIYYTAPQKFERVAILDATRLGRANAPRSQSYAIKQLKGQAAALGANGILLLPYGHPPEMACCFPPARPAYQAIAIYVPGAEE